MAGVRQFSATTDPSSSLIAAVAMTVRGHKALQATPCSGRRGPGKGVRERGPGKGVRALFSGTDRVVAEVFYAASKYRMYGIARAQGCATRHRDILTNRRKG
jgi:hypothetical protein